ncbi:alpha/beta fold hydrolase [Caulobacter sp. KR2-114]|uniref:alpha/beta fold hydrolase n=1 Tax=Caulobacter sp. KR2-114 TaxID=3400912 RepID=UPI003C129247
MSTKRATGVLALGWACFESAATGRTEHRPTSADYPESVVRRTSFTAGAGLGWRISALETPRERPAPWKIVVITGAPSWAEYWAPAMAALPQDREMLVIDRPGFAASEPATCVPDIRLQAQALMPAIAAAPGQKILLVGQSYGAAIATLMAGMAPRPLGGVVLLSSFLGEFGPTAKWLVDLGGKVLNLIPRDLRHAVMEVSGQSAQLTHMRQTLARLKVPVHVIHGDQDDFAPATLAEALVKDTRTRAPIRFELVPGANHFLNDGPAEALIACLEGCLPKAKAPFQFKWPAWSPAVRAAAPVASPAPAQPQHLPAPALAGQGAGKPELAAA